MPTPGFSHKVWKDQPDHTTPISAAAIEDLEDRVTQFALDTAAALSNTFKGVWSSGTTYALGNGVSVGLNNYISTINANTNHNPVGDDGSHWTPLIPSSVLSVSSPKFATIVLTPTGSDDTAQINSAITALSGFGDVILGPGTFLLNSATITMPRAATGFRLRGAGRGVTILKPAASVKRAIDFPHVADYDTYSNITLQDFSIDGSLLTLPAANQGVVGNLIGGGWSARVTFTNIRCYRITVTGVPFQTVTGLGKYQGFSFGCRHGGTTVTAGSNGVDVTTFAGAGTLNVTAPQGFPASSATGNITVVTSTGTATLSYTGNNGTAQFTGVGLVSGTGLLATGNLVTEATQNTMTGFVWEDLTLLGGNAGLAIVAQNNGASSPITGVNVVIDDINWNRCYDDTLVTPASGISSASGGQIGGSAQGGTYRLTNCTFINVHDVYEFDCAQTLLVTNCTGRDCKNGAFFVCNFNTPKNPQAQTAVFENCHTQTLNAIAGTGLQCPGFTLGPPSNVNVPYGNVILNDCSHTSYVASPVGNQSHIEVNGRFLRALTLNNFTASIENMADTSAGAQNPVMLNIRPCCDCHLTIRNLKIKVNGTTTNASWAPRWVQLGDLTNNANLELDIEGISVYQAVTGVTAGNTISITITGLAGGTFRGVISRFRFRTGTTGDSGIVGINLPSAASYPISTVNDAGLVIRDCDFSAGGATSKDVVLNDATQRARLFYYNNKWGTLGPSIGKGRKTGATYFAGAFSTGVGNQYLGGFAGRLLLSAGAGVTAIDISQDGGVTYDNLLTQGAAAITGTINTRIEQGDLLKLTYTTTVPTVVVLPDK